jgi:sugar lactone lactonase YvrE
MMAAAGWATHLIHERHRKMRNKLAGVLGALALVVSGQMSAGATAAHAATGGYVHVATLAGSACLTSPASAMAVQPTGVLSDGAGGFYVSIADAVHSMICRVGADGSVTPFAGNGTPGFIPGGYGDGVDASKVSLYDPYGIAVRNGTVYFAERMNNLVRKVDPAGVVSIVAGNGAFGYSGDGGPARAAALNQPTGVAVDPAGNVYIADASNNRIRRVDTSGVITTVAGTGVQGFGGDGGPATAAALNFPGDIAFGPASQLYISDGHNNRVRMVAANGVISTVAGGTWPGYAGDKGPASRALLNNPVGLAVDASGSLFIADANNSSVRKVDSTGTISTVAGSGVEGFSGDGGPATQAKLSWPLDVSLDAAGGLLIADNGFNNRVRRVDSTGRISTIAGNGTMGLAADGGPANRAELSQVNDVAVDGVGNVYIADAQSNAVRMVNKSTGAIATIVGGTDGPLSFPSGVVLNGSDLFIADSWHHRVLKRSASGTITTVAGNGQAGYSGDGGAAASARLNVPMGLSVDTQGNLYIADSLNNVIRRVSPTGTISTFAGTGAKTSGSAPLGDGGEAKKATFAGPVGLGFDPARATLYVADRDNHRVRKISLGSGVIATVAGTGNRGFSQDGTAATATLLNAPAAVAVDANGSLFISDHGNCIVRQIDSAGRIATVAGWTPARGVQPICNDYADPSNHPRAWMLQHPLGIAFDSTGNLYVADAYANKVLVLSK